MWRHVIVQHSMVYMSPKPLPLAHSLESTARRLTLLCTTLSPGAQRRAPPAILNGPIRHTPSTTDESMTTTTMPSSSLHFPVGSTLSNHSRRTPPPHVKLRATMKPNQRLSIRFTSTTARRDKTRSPRTLPRQVVPAPRVLIDHPPPRP